MPSFFLNRINKLTPYGIISIALTLSMFGWSKAGEIAIQPRIEMGSMFYEFESEGIGYTHEILGNVTMSSSKYNDIMPFLSGGVTLFKDRFFLDISGQYAFDGQDTTTATRSVFVINNYDAENDFFESTYIGFQSNNNAKIDRHDIAFSLGYALTEQTSLYTGYKQAKTEFKEIYSGQLSWRQYDKNEKAEDYDYFFSRVSGEGTLEFDYSGPFIGMTHGWDFSDNSILKGMLTMNLALAYLQGKVKTKGNEGYATLEWIDDLKIEQPNKVATDSILTRSSNTSGQAAGLTLSVRWQGPLYIEGLSYIVGLNAYRYEFNNNDYNHQNIAETAIKFKLGVSYLF